MFPSAKKKPFCIGGLKITLLKCFDELTGKPISTVTGYYLVIVARRAQVCKTGKISHFPKSLLWMTISYKLLSDWSWTENLFYEKKSIYTLKNVLPSYFKNFTVEQLVNKKSLYNFSTLESFCPFEQFNCCSLKEIMALTSDFMEMHGNLS